MNKRIAFILAAVLFSLQLSFAQSAPVKYLTGRSENGQPHLFWFGAAAAESSLYYDDGTAEWPVFVSEQWADNQLLVRFGFNDAFFLVTELSAFIFPENSSTMSSKFAFLVRKDTGSGKPGAAYAFDTVEVNWSGEQSRWVAKNLNLLMVNETLFWGAIHWFSTSPKNPMLGRDVSDVGFNSYVGHSGALSQPFIGNWMLRAMVLANNPATEAADSFWVYRGSDSNSVSHVATINLGNFDYLDVPQSGGAYFYRVTRWEGGVESPLSNVAGLTASGTDVPVEHEKKTVFLLSEPFPNPFSSNVLFTARTDRQMEVGFSIYNLLGQRVYFKPMTHYSAGEHSFLWDGRDESGRTLSSGLYFLRFQAGEEVFFKKVTLLH